MVIQIHFPNHHYEFSPPCYYLIYFTGYAFLTDQSCLSGPNVNSVCFTQIVKYLWTKPGKEFLCSLDGSTYAPDFENQGYVNTAREELLSSSVTSVHRLSKAAEVRCMAGSFLC